MIRIRSFFLEIGLRRAHLERSLTYHHMVDTE